MKHNNDFQQGAPNSAQPRDFRKALREALASISVLRGPNGWECDAMLPARRFHRLLIGYKTREAHQLFKTEVESALHADFYGE